MRTQGSSIGPNISDDRVEVKHIDKVTGTAQWLTTFQSFHQSLKALGDVENWARTIEADMAFINSSLEQVQSAREGEQLLPPPTPAAAASSSSDPPEPFTPDTPREPPAAQ